MWLEHVEGLFRNNQDRLHNLLKEVHVNADDVESKMREKRSWFESIIAFAFGAINEGRLRKISHKLDTMEEVEDEVVHVVHTHDQKIFEIERNVQRVIEEVSHLLTVFKSDLFHWM